jgi:hypothetical protein
MGLGWEEMRYVEMILNVYYYNPNNSCVILLLCFLVEKAKSDWPCC